MASYTPTKLKQLQNHLSKGISDPNKIRQIAIFSHIDVTNIDLSGSASDQWFTLLFRANDQVGNVVQELINNALESNPNNRYLIEAKNLIGNNLSKPKAEQPHLTKEPTKSYNQRNETEETNYEQNRALHSPLIQGSTEKIPAKPGPFKALLIANNQYDDSRIWTSLKTPLKDAESLQQILKRNYGFVEVTLLKDATRKSIYKGFKNLIEKAHPEDNILIFYAGHGYFDKKNTETGYWIPTDAEGEEDHSFVENAVIRDRVAQLSRKSKHVFLISDSCFSGELLSSRGGRKIQPEEKSNYFNQKYSDRSCQVLTSGSNEYVEDRYRNSGHSPFAYFLLSKLKQNKDTYFSASALSVHLAETVSNTAGQTPKHGVLKTSEDEGGEFFFIQKPQTN